MNLPTLSAHPRGLTVGYEKINLIISFPCREASTEIEFVFQLVDTLPGSRVHPRGQLVGVTKDDRTASFRCNAHERDNRASRAGEFLKRTTNDISRLKAEGKIEKRLRGFDYALKRVTCLAFLIKKLGCKLRIGVVCRGLSDNGSRKKQEDSPQKRRAHACQSLIRYCTWVHRGRSLTTIFTLFLVRLSAEYGLGGWACAICQLADLGSSFMLL